ncbi:MAG: MATE family efflux transporter [Oscillospiraceae bacterium]|nr:MATE family efflux transporter [Oscillospiraceae bacterium]
MAEHSEQKLGSAPLGKLMLSLALPSLMAQLVNLLYNMVDRIYIGHIPGEGALALTGLGICNPILLIVAAFAQFVGAGGSPLAAIALGQGDRDKAERILGSGTTLLLIFSALLTLGFYGFRKPILFAFGASEATFPYADAYLSVYLLGTFFVLISLGLNAFISCQGAARTAMLSVLLGAVTNIILDPIFIFGLNMGVKGAALATVISQGFSALWILCFLCSGRSAIRLRLAFLRPDRLIIQRSAALGVSPFIMSSTECLIVIVYNTQLQRFGGDLHVGSMTILLSAFSLFSCIVRGVAAGVQPIMSFNYGAGNHDRVTLCFKRSLFICVGISAVGTLFSICFPGALASLYTDDAALIALCREALPIYLASLWIFGAQMVVQQFFLALGQAGRSFFIAVLRKIILLTPMILLFPRFWGVMGIYVAEPISDFISASTSLLVAWPLYKKLKNRSVD